jgi:hypothetical protein
VGRGDCGAASLIRSPYPRTCPIPRFARSGGSCASPSDWAGGNQGDCVLVLFASSTLPDVVRAARPLLPDVFLGVLLMILIEFDVFRVMRLHFIFLKRTPLPPRLPLRHRSFTSVPHSFFRSTPAS